MAPQPAATRLGDAPAKGRDDRSSDLIEVGMRYVGRNMGHGVAVIVRHRVVVDPDRAIRRPGMGDTSKGGDVGDPCASSNPPRFPCGLPVGSSPALIPAKAGGAFDRAGVRFPADITILPIIGGYGGG